MPWQGRGGLELQDSDLSCKLPLPGNSTFIFSLVFLDVFLGNLWIESRHCVETSKHPKGRLNSDSVRPSHFRGSLAHLYQHLSKAHACQHIICSNIYANAANVISTFSPCWSQLDSCQSNGSWSSRNQEGCPCSPSSDCFDNVFGKQFVQPADLCLPLFGQTQVGMSRWSTFVWSLYNSP